MKSLFCVVAVLTLAGCEADGKPSKLWGSALGGFSKGFEKTSSDIQADQASRPPITGQAVQSTAVPQPSAQAAFTGQAKQVQTVTGAMAWECVYDYAGQKFVRLFEAYCPTTTAVR